MPIRPRPDAARSDPVSGAAAATPDSFGRAAGAPLGRRVAALRADKGWTQQDLADRLGISRVAVSHLEAGMTDPGERTVALLAGVFHLEPHDLVAGTAYPAGKAERLPVVVARYTEVEHQLLLFESDLAWAGRLADPATRREVADRWRPILKRLASDSFDGRELAQVAAARRRLNDLA
jgi:transcriptional regulator with XRE-family HTH domain